MEILSNKWVWLVVGGAVLAYVFMGGDVSWFNWEQFVEAGK